MMYRKKPVVIEARQLNGYTLFEIMRWIDDGGGRAKNWSWDSEESTMPYPERHFFIETLEGDMKAEDGDYIIKGIKGEFYPCKPDIFELTYERIEQ
jgi:hypothetical protein